MMTAVLSLAVANLSPIQFDLVISKLAANRARAEVVVKNVSKSNVVLVKPIFDGNPSASLLISAEVDGKYVYTFGKSSTPQTQVMVGNRVDASRFWTLKPGQSQPIGFEEFDGYYVSKRPGIYEKSDLAEANIRTFERGSYGVRAVYSFDPKEDRKWIMESRRKIEFGPGAESLWKAAWSGKAQLNGIFVVP